MASAFSMLSSNPLADKIKVFLLVLFIPSGAVWPAERIQACKPSRALSDFTARSGTWLPETRILRDATVRNTYPITGIKIYEGKIWVGTYQSDYSPVSTAIKDDLIEIQNIRFLFAPAHVNNNKAVNFVRPYAKEGVSYFLDIKCTQQDKIKILIYLNKIEKRPDELIIFHKQRS